jgi:transcription-repair coupling factor (superfamily II helicase)
MYELVACRWKAQVLGIEKITLKGNILKLYFVSMEAQSNTGTTIIGQVIQFVNTKKGSCQLREKGGKLILQVEKVSTIKDLNSILIDILG